MSARVFCLGSSLPSITDSLCFPEAEFLHLPSLLELQRVLKDRAAELILVDISVEATLFTAFLQQEHLDVPLIAVVPEVSEDLLAKIMEAGGADCIAGNQKGHLRQAMKREINGVLLRRKLRDRRMESIRSLTSRLAHDFNNVLAPITMSAPMLKWEMEDAEFDEIIDTMEESALMGAGMIRDLHTFGRGLELHRVAIEPGDFIRETEQNLQTLPEGIRMEIRADKDLPQIFADPERLQQVFQSLVQNACEAMVNGGVLEIRMGKEYGGRGFWLSVSDSGEGIEPGALDQIFDPFFSSKRHLRKGAGLGLSRALGIIMGHGGRISVKSERGKGSSFLLTLPAKKP